MLELKNQIQHVRLENEKTLIQRQINALDTEIDSLVYQLYGLTEEGIALVEGSVK